VDANEREIMAEAKLIDGKAHAARLRQRVGAGVAQLVAKGGPKPGLATILVESLREAGGTVDADVENYLRDGHQRRRLRFL
jgi:5,10-methylene-tetrahydrofolate dehydrogenase/methenyl tetrahydrofolate cyclohydrolase